MNVKNLKKVLEAMDDNQNVVFEYKVQGEPIVASYSIDEVEDRFGFCMLISNEDG